MRIFNPDYIREFYSRHIPSFPTNPSKDSIKVNCPCHEDSTPSLSIDLTAGSYKCFGADCALFDGGGIVQFLAAVDKIPYHEASSRIETEYSALYPNAKGKKKKDKVVSKFPHTQEDINTCMQDLMSMPDKLEFLHKKCLWTLDTIKKFEIGYSKADTAYWVPLRENGILVNIRKYAPGSFAKWRSVTGFGGNKLFPFRNLDGDTIYLMEGEKDCILANQLGLNAVTTTVGAGNFEAEWRSFFARKNIIICYDIDPAGRDGAMRIAGALAPVARSVKVVDLDITVPDNADFTDYILSGKTIQDFMHLVDIARVERAPSESPVDIPDKVIEATLDEIDSKKLFYQRVLMDVRVLSKDVSPYLAMGQANVTCLGNNKPHFCADCTVGHKGNQDSVIINETTPRLLDLIECTSDDKKRLIRDIFHIPPCTKFTLKEVGHQAIHKVSVIPSIDEIDYDDETYNQKYVERELYFIGGRLEANNDYEIECIAVPSPKDQSLVLVGYKAKPADSSIEEFRMIPELKKKLEIFQCASEKS